MEVLPQGRLSPGPQPAIPLTFVSSPLAHSPALIAQVNTEEWQFFLKGGSVLDRSQQAANPASTWISEEAWDNVTELDLLPNFKGIASSFESSAGET